MQQTPDVKVPIEPFSRWINWMVRVYGDYVAVAVIVGFNPSTVLHWAQGWRPPTDLRERGVYENDRVPITEIWLRRADEALTNADMDETIWSLWPDLSFEVVA